MTNFWKALREKLIVNPTEKKDRKFWAAFDKEFNEVPLPKVNRNPKRTSPFSWFGKPAWAAMAASLVLISLATWRNSERMGHHVSESALVQDAPVHEDILSDIEFFSDFETVDALMESEDEAEQEVI